MSNEMSNDPPRPVPRCPRCGSSDATERELRAAQVRIAICNVCHAVWEVRRPTQFRVEK